MNKALEIVGKFTNVVPMLNSLRQGKVINNTISVVGRLAAVVAGVWFLIEWFQWWGFLKNCKFLNGLGFAVFMLGMPVAAFVILKIFFIRCGEVKDFPDAEFAVAPVVAHLLKTLGEMAIFLMGIMSVPTMIHVWLGPSGFAALFTGRLFYEGARFWPGIEAALSMWLKGFVGLVVAYFAAELILALFSIANNVNKMSPSKPSA